MRYSPIVAGRRKRDTQLIARREGRDLGIAEVRVGDGGWVLFDEQRPGKDGRRERLLVRVVPDESGNYRIRELHLLDDGAAITAARLRALTLATFERFLDLPEVREALTTSLERPAAFDLEALGLRPVTRVSGGGVVVIQESAALAAPARRGYPDEFYERVAETYRTNPKRPVVAIAVAAGVPRTTAARWVKEARARGKLRDAPAPGKAGG
jgi:hypothetical protein